VTPLQQYFESHAHPTQPYWEIGLGHNAWLAHNTGGYGQVFMLADGKIVDAHGRPFGALLRPHLKAICHTPQLPPAPEAPKLPEETPVERPSELPPV
jgi:hypothetical protein